MSLTTVQFACFRNMASKELIDAQFDRAVEIVQSLPKTGPIQTDYEEKLTMYRYAALHCSVLGKLVLTLLPAVCISKVHSRARVTSVRELNVLFTPAATVGNVKTPRPGIWDMLGRAKW